MHECAFTGRRFLHYSLVGNGKRACPFGHLFVTKLSYWFVFHKLQPSWISAKVLQRSQAPFLGLSLYPKTSQFLLSDETMKKILRFLIQPIMGQKSWCVPEGHVSKNSFLRWCRPQVNDWPVWFALDSLPIMERFHITDDTTTYNRATPGIWG